MKQIEYPKLLASLVKSLQKWADEIPTLVFLAHDSGESLAILGSLRGGVSQYRDLILARLGVDRLDYLARMVENAVQRVLEAGSRYLPECCDNTYPEHAAEYRDRVATLRNSFEDHLTVRQHTNWKTMLYFELIECEQTFKVIDNTLQAITTERSGRAITTGDGDEAIMTERSDQATLPSPSFTPLEQKLLDVIRDANRPITMKEILDRLSQNGEIHSTGTTQNYLSAMVRYRVLKNHQDCDPPGYSLREDAPI